MCILLFYVNPTPKADEFHLILVNIRDEIYHRPTKLAGFYSDNPNVIGGMDMEPGKQGGSWLAMHKNGKIGSLLNILQPEQDILPNKKGRGFLAIDFVTGSNECLQYLNDLKMTKDDYNGFLLVLIDLRKLSAPVLAYYSNSGNLDPVSLEPGIHCYGNSKDPTKPWPKVGKAKANFTDIIKKFGSKSTKSVLVEKVFDMLRDRTSYGVDSNMKEQGINLSEYFLKKLSAIFVHVPESKYGSRCHTVILIDATGKVDYYERSRKEDSPPESDEEWLSTHKEFDLQH